MIVVDTNIVVRFALNDDPDQAAIARTLFETHTISISRTVALETEWVLRSRYDKGRKQIPEYFNKLLAMKNVRIEAESAFRNAVAWYAVGDDFADALHLANAGGVLHLRRRVLQTRDRPWQRPSGGQSREVNEEISIQFTRFSAFYPPLIATTARSRWRCSSTPSARAKETTFTCKGPHRNSSSTTSRLWGTT